VFVQSFLIVGIRIIVQNFTEMVNKNRVCNLVLYYSGQLKITAGCFSAPQGVYSVFSSGRLKLWAGRPSIVVNCESSTYFASLVDFEYLYYLGQIVCNYTDLVLTASTQRVPGSKYYFATRSTRPCAVALVSHVWEGGWGVLLYFSVMAGFIFHFAIMQ
jgi:hypothetical protein